METEEKREKKKVNKIEQILDEDQDMLAEAKPFINLMMQYKCAIKSRLKSPASIYEKLRRKRINKRKGTVISPLQPFCNQFLFL